MKIRSWATKFLVEEVQSFNLLESDELCVHFFALCNYFSKDLPLWTVQTLAQCKQSKPVPISSR